MSKENLDQFVQKVTDSEELQARIGDEMDADSLIALGAEHGFEFTAEDLAANVELSYEELDGVAGGAVSIDTKAAQSGFEAAKYRLVHKHGAHLVPVLSSVVDIMVGLDIEAREVE